MKFLHITIPSKRMMETYIKMIRDNYPEEEHTFYFLSKCPPSEKCLFDYGNVFELDEGTSKITKIKNFYNDLNKYDYIIWHGLVLSPKFALFLNIARWFLKKSIWVMWGIDLYSFRRERNGIKNRIINYLNYNIRKSIAYPVAIFPTDIDMYKRIFNSNKQVYYAPYPIRSSVFEDMESASDVMPRKNGEIWIQIGNNANSFNRHFDIIDALSKFAQEKIKVFIPMSYGNDWHNRENNYIDNVRERAIEIFGEDKVFVLKNLMSIEEYSRFLQQIDIMIIATDRQNALGNILKNMYCGGKTYLSEKNKLFSYFKSIGVKIQSFEDIKDKSFEEFISLVDNSNIKNWMIENHYPDMNINFWDNLFSSLKHHETGIEIKSKVVVKDSNEILNNIKCNSKVHEKKNYINLDRFLYKK